VPQGGFSPGARVGSWSPSATAGGEDWPSTGRKPPDRIRLTGHPRVLIAGIPLAPGPVYTPAERRGRQGSEMKRKPGMFAEAVREAAAAAGDARQEGEGTVLYEYPDYETYRRVQEQGNITKLGAQYVKKSHIFFLALYLREAIAPVHFGLCHGTRRGKEQGWFRRKLRGAEVIGTEISETAKDFPNTLQWDFHQPNPDWAGRADFVYSNSWDHSFAPARAFRVWAETLRPGGLLLLDHTRGHLPGSASALDPFGATEAALKATLEGAFDGIGTHVETLDRSDDPEYPARVLVFRRF
jgi:SAM-dependent methyltransferase